MVSSQGRAKGATRDTAVGHTLLNGEYQVKQVLGHGGMGEVFLVSHPSITVPLALKQARADQPLPEHVIAELDELLGSQGKLRRRSRGSATAKDFPSSGGVHTDRFLREALMLARLQHPAIPGLYDYFFEDGDWYLVMDYIPGQTLNTYLRQHTPLPPLEALNYTMQLCDVLDYLHQQTPPVIFRDLKPSNIILMPEGRLILVDFGIARYFKSGQFNDTTDFGSPGYASPEQYKGEVQTDGRSDIFSLGIILHEMLSGQRPSGRGGQLPPLRSIDPAISCVLSGLVTVATRPEPMYRFQSTHTFYQALERIYLLEERRAYQQRLLDEEGEKRSQCVPLVKPQRYDTLPPAEEQRRLQIQEIIQEARQGRLERERQETHLASVDESLNQRVAIPLSGFPPLLDEETALLPEPNLPSLARRIIQASFFVTLLLFMAMSSLLIYGRVFHHPTVSSSGEITAAPSNHPVSSLQSSWQVLPSLPSPEADNTAMYVQVQGRAYIYMSGGYRGATAPLYDHGLYRYDIAAAHWEKLEERNFPGMVNNAIALDERNRLFFTVGYSTDSYAVTSLIYMYTPDKRTVQKIRPPSQMPIGFGTGMVADQHGHLYMTEGFRDAGKPEAAAGTGWYSYDIAANSWHLLAPLPLGLGYVVLASDDNGGILLLGGATDAGKQHPVNQLYRYDIQQNVWTQEQATTPVAFSGAASCQSRPGQLTVIGGYDPASKKVLNQSWLLDLRTLRWSPLASLPVGGSVLGAAACDGQGHVFLVRGANNANQPSADFWELRIG